MTTSQNCHDNTSHGNTYAYITNTSVHRLSDWIGYDHAIDYLFKCTTMEGKITRGVAITFTIYMQLKLGDFASRFDNMYLGIMMWSKTPTVNRHIKTTTTQIKDLGTIAQITFTATDTEWMPAADWMMSLFVSKSIASTFVSDKSQNYYVSKWTTGNCEAIPFIDKDGIIIEES